MKSSFISVICILLTICILVSCSPSNLPEDTKNQETTAETLPPPDAAIINGKELSKFSIVYPNEDDDYAKRAAEYIQKMIKEKTNLELPIITDSAAQAKYEIVVGETSRDISKALDADTTGMQFSILADDDQIALEGDRFVIAAAAYYFIETYITSDKFYADVPTTASVCEPIVKEAKNYIFLIGDGMGKYQTKLFEYMDIPTENNFSDNEDIFYGYMFPAQGLAQTRSLSGITDSAAGGTALATGYRTNNEFVGINKSKEAVQSLTELANSLGMSTAVLSTDAATGATPAAFTTHVENRDMSVEISKQQLFLRKDHGTITTGGLKDYEPDKVKNVENTVITTIDKLDDNENGFFMMYEEGYIDKHSHSNDMSKTFLAVLKFNQVIATVMEYAFYNPNTFIIMTADHETGDLRPDSSGELKYNSENHSGANVPVFAYGHGAERFNEKTIINVQIPKTIAHFWGVEDFGDPKLAGALK